MNRISTLLLAAAVASPLFSLAEVKTSSVEVGLYSQKDIAGANNNLPSSKNQPGEYHGSWKSADGAFKYDTEADCYIIENFLGVANANLKFQVGAEETKDPDVQRFKAEDPDCFNPVRYDFNIIYDTKSDKTTGLKYADLCEGVIRPWSSAKRTFAFSGSYSFDGDYMCQFKKDSKNYSWLVGVPGNSKQSGGPAIYATNPQSYAVSTGTGTGTGTGGGEGGSSYETKESYVVKNGDNYTVYLHCAPKANNHAIVETYKNKGYSGEEELNYHFLVFSFNKNFSQTGIDNIAVDTEDANAPVEYFNLQGVRVENPSNGLYIRRQGKTVSKVIL